MWAKHSRKWQCLIQVRRFNGQTPRFLTRCWSSSQLNFCQGSWQDIIKMNIVFCLLDNPPTSILYLHNSFGPNHTLFGINSNHIGSNGSIQFSKKNHFGSDHCSMIHRFDPMTFRIHDKNSVTLVYTPGRCLGKYSITNNNNNDNNNNNNNDENNTHPSPHPMPQLVIPTSSQLPSAPWR